MPQSVADFIVERMSAWVSGGSSDTRATASTAWSARSEKQSDKAGAARIDFIQARHEEMAAFMACGHAKITGETGVCLATGGPGAVHLINGLRCEGRHQPGWRSSGSRRAPRSASSYQQEIDLAALFKDVACRLRTDDRRAATGAARDRPRVSVSRGPSGARRASSSPATCRRCRPRSRSARTSPPIRGPATRRRSWCRPTATSSAPRRHPQRRQANRDPRRAPARADAAAEVIAVAEILQAGIAKALLGKDVIDDELPFVTGSIGLLGTEPTHDMMTRLRQRC
jgi:pyruvate dehydrogenase (quinone)